MELANPGMMVADYVMAGVLIAFGTRLLAGRPEGATRTLLWAVAMLLIAATGLAGGTYNGFHPWLPSALGKVLASTSHVLIPLASTLMLVVAADMVLTGRARRVFKAVAIAKSGISIPFLLTHLDVFEYVLFDYVPSLVVVLALALHGATRLALPSARWIVAGILVSFVAAGVQLSGVSAEGLLQTNQIYIAIQVIGFWSLYRAGVRLEEPAPSPDSTRSGDHRISEERAAA